MPHIAPAGIQFDADTECLAGFSGVQTALPAIQEITGRLFKLIPAERRFCTDTALRKEYVAYVDHFLTRINRSLASRRAGARLGN
jgi:hypothetical protein